MEEAEKVEMIALHWALSFQAIALRDLAGAFARYDAAAARQMMIHTIELRCCPNSGKLRTLRSFT